MHLAQLNIAHAKWNIEAPEMAGFRNNVDAINKLAEEQEGFVWRFDPSDKDINPFGNDNILTNMSVWTNKKALLNYVYHTEHSKFIKRKKEWFQHITKVSMVLWFIDVGHTPTLIEAKERLDYLIEFGNTPFAFSFKSKFTSNDAKTYLTKTS